MGVIRWIGRKLYGIFRAVRTLISTILTMIAVAKAVQFMRSTYRKENSRKEKERM